MTYKVLFILSQPTQSVVPLEILAKSTAIDLTVFYLSAVDGALWQGEEFINKSSLKLAIPSAIKSIQLKNFSPFPSLKYFFGLIHPGLVLLIPKYDFVVVYGHAYFSMCLAIILAKLTGKRLLLSNDAVENVSTNAFKWRVKKWLYKLLYNKIADGVLVPSSKAKAYQESLGVRADNIFLTPYVVDNQKIIDLSEKLDKQVERKTLDIPLQKKVVLFVGKLIERKNPLDLLNAFHLAAIEDSYLVYVGNGPLFDRLQAQIEYLDINDKVKCLGELSYDKLVGAYIAADILVHPAEFEPWGLIVNEAMLCGLPVIASNKVGAALDLVEQTGSGLTYKAGDIEELAETLKAILSDNNKRREFGIKAKARMQSWSPFENAAAHLIAIEKIRGC